jgi:fibronectin-binding autotransporter adhesin
MKKKSHAALAIALVTGAWNAEAAKAGLYTPTALQNGNFDYDITIATPSYTYNQTISSWYRVTAGEGWQAQSDVPIANGSGPAYAFLQGDGTNPGEIFQSIGTFTPNYNVSVSLLEAYIQGDTGHKVTVSLYSGGTAVSTGTNTYGAGYGTYNLSGATLLGAPQTINDTGTNAFSGSALTFNTGTTGSKGATLWLAISTDATDTATQLAVNNVVATGAALSNVVVWTGAISSTWDSSTANFSNASGGVAFSNGLDTVFNDVAAGKSTISLSGNLSPATITFNNNSSTYTLAGAGSITGGTLLTKNGTGSVVLATSNSFTGPVAINAGQVILQNAYGLGTSQTVTVASGATLAFQTSGGAATISNNPVAINGTGSAGQGALENLSGDNTLDGTLTLVSNSIVNVASGSLTIIGSIYGTGGLTKTGSGTLIYNALNHYTGDTNVMQGTLVSEFFNSFIGTNVNVSSGATLEITTSFADVSTNLNIAAGGTVAASGGDAIGYGGNNVKNVNIMGGTFNIADDQNEGYNTNWILAAGSMASTGGGSFNFALDGSSSITSNSNTSTSVISGPMILRDDSGSGNLLITVASGATNGIDLQISGAISGASDAGIDKEGPGTLALTGINTLVGTINVGQGTLMLGDGLAGHDGVTDPAMTITDNAAVVFNTNTSQTFGGSITGSGTLSKIGPGTLMFAGSTSGSLTTYVSAGKLYVTGNLSSSSGVSVAAGATLGGTGSVNAPVTVASGGVIEAGVGGTGQLSLSSLTFSGGGTINIGNLSSYSSGTALQVNGTLTTAGSNSVALTISNLTGATTGTAYPLIGYSSENASVSAYSLHLPRGDVGTLSDTNNQIDLTLSAVGGAYYLEWTGAGNAANGWDTTTTNWKLNGTTPTAYIDMPGDPVVFDDGAGANTTVAIKSGNVHPASVTFNNSISTYAITGPNGIAGSTGITLNGTGTVILESSNTYSGATVISAGNLQLGTGTSGHDGSIRGSSGITNNGTLTFDDTTAQTYGGPISGTGNVTVSGTGAVTITAGQNLDIGTLALAAGATVTLAPIVSVTPAAPTQDFSSIIVNAGATLNIATTHTFGYSTGTRPALIINGGNVTNSLGNDNYLGAVTMTGGTINGTGNFRLQDLGASSDSTVTTLPGSTTATISVSDLDLVPYNGNPIIFNVGQGSVTAGPDLLVSSNIADLNSDNAGSLVKIGAGQMTLTGNNSYSGGTTINAGTLAFASATAFPASTTLTILGGTAVASNHGTGAKNNIFTNNLSIAGSSGAWTGKLDLQNNDMIVFGGNLGIVTSELAEGYNNGGWNGSGGIVSGAAAANTAHLTALGVIDNDNGSGSPLYTSFDGSPTNDGDVLVKYTYYGDANLDGKVDGSDYSRIDNGYLLQLTGWGNGDFNYDGVINGSDYTLIDNAYNTQGAVIASELAPTAQVAGSIVISAVPEPATFGLLGICAIGLLGRRGRHKPGSGSLLAAALSL